MKYINLTPTWEGILPALLAVVTNGETVEARKTAEDELRRMARLADAYVEGVHGARLDDDFDPADAQRKGF